MIISRLKNVQNFTNNSLKWSETCQETIKAPEMNKIYELIISGVGCEDTKQSTTPIEVKTETFLNGVIALADTSKINSTLGKFLQYIKYIFIASIMTLGLLSNMFFLLCYFQKFGNNRVYFPKL
jgi:hypothetical protein